MSSRLQRSAVSFRRHGSSGRIWDDPLRSLDLKGPSTPTAAAAVAPLADASLARDPSPRAAASSRSIVRHGSAAGIAESPETSLHYVRPPSSLPRDDHGRTPRERGARRRRRISSAFCACMGHPPASHAQQ